MSDLCHNCGDCHLGAQATKCRKELQECIICHSFGHTYNFCPRSVHQLDDKYIYLMLCHNCDSWHLPKACERQLKHCERCHQYGHMVFFCPVNPEPRSRVDEPVGAKRQRGQDGGRELVQARIAPATEVQQVHPQLLRDIKLYAVRDAFTLLENYTHADVLQYFGRPVLPPLQAMTGAMQHVPAFAAPQYSGDHATDAPDSWAAAGQPRGDTFEPGGQPFDPRGEQHVEQQTPGSPTMLPTPASATEPRTSTAQEQTVPSVYQTMHDRFEHGELAVAQDAQEPRSDSVTQSPAPGSVDTRSTPAGEKKATAKSRRSVTRCATCKKRHMKCKHFDEEGNPKDPGVQPAVSSTANSVNELPSTMGLVYEPSIGQLVTQEEQDTIRVGNGQKTMRDHIVATDQAMNGELPEFDDTRRDYHGDIYQVDWLGSAKDHAQSAFAMDDQAPGMMPQSTDSGQQWVGSEGMQPVGDMYGVQNVMGEQAVPTAQELERNLTQMLSEEPGLGPRQSHFEPGAFGGNVSVALMGTAQPVAPKTDAKVVAKADSVGTPEAEASVADLVEPPQKKKGGGRKRGKAA